jgi:hypothetical protein
MSEAHPAFGQIFINVADAVFFTSRSIFPTIVYKPKIPSQLEPPSTLSSNAGHSEGERHILSNYAGSAGRS